ALGRRVRAAIARDLARGPRHLRTVAPERFDDWDDLAGTVAVWRAAALSTVTLAAAVIARYPDVAVIAAPVAAVGSLLCVRRAAQMGWLARAKIAYAALDGLVPMPGLAQFAADATQTSRPYRTVG